MASLKGFNAQQVEPMGDYTPLPAGKYPVAITESEEKRTKNGQGSYLALTFEVLDGQYKGRKVWTNLNMDNRNPLTVKIARSELSSICRAVGVMEPKDSCELHGIPLEVTVKVVQDDQKQERNKITAYNRRPVSPAAQPQGRSSVAPWNRQPATAQ